ncbi:MAG: hypothetical protein LBL74_05275 [Bacteroidales bacterium]|jgi:hypothetical protein|nr:hypothetical protein [Bacteroidales bacterium]
MPFFALFRALERDFKEFIQNFLTFGFDKNETNVRVALTLFDSMALEPKIVAVFVDCSAVFAPFIAW